MSYLTTLSLYSLLFGLGYVATLLRRAQLVRSGTELQHQLPALKPLYAQVVLSVLFKPKHLLVAHNVQPSLPALSIISRAVTINKSKLLAYRNICQFPDSTHVPIVYPAVETFSMNLACMCMKAFPISVLGGVLARYKAVMHQPIQATDVLTFR